MKSYFIPALLASTVVGGVTFFSGESFAACVTAPSCATLGYTETSCANGGVRCPFDTTKWHCDKENCEVFELEYTCTGTGYLGGKGVGCNGKYAKCNCATGYVWKNGICGKAPATAGLCCDNMCGIYEQCMRYGSTDCGVIRQACRAAGGDPQFLTCRDVFASDGSRINTLAEYGCYQ